LVDIRHEPGQNDVDMYRWCLEYGFNPIVIATKSDKISRGQINKHTAIIRKKLNCIEGTPILPFSSLKKTGGEEIWEYIEDSLLAFQGEQDNEEV
jgi:GTP-binding protein